jgi:hypothetical protein
VLGRIEISKSLTNMLEILFFNKIVASSSLESLDQFIDLCYLACLTPFSVVRDYSARNCSNSATTPA